MLYSGKRGGHRARLTVTDWNNDGIYVVQGTAVTDAVGWYLFPDLPDGDYLVRVDTNDNAVGVTYGTASGATGSGTPSVTASLNKFNNDWNTLVVNPYGEPAFVELEDDTSDVFLLTGAICGELCQLGSKTVSIDIQKVAIRGLKKNSRLAVYYTTDGSMPTQNSRAYVGPFEIELGTTVKAMVIREGEPVFMMEETFDEGIGLYWGGP